jgi:hypothetical protein
MLPLVPAPLVSSLEFCEFKREQAVLEQNNDQIARIALTGTCTSIIGELLLQYPQAIHDRNFNDPCILRTVAIKSTRSGNSKLIKGIGQSGICQQNSSLQHAILGLPLQRQVRMEPEKGISHLAENCYC